MCLDSCFDHFRDVTNMVAYQHSDTNAQSYDHEYQLKADMIHEYQDTDGQHLDIVY